MAAFSITYLSVTGAGSQSNAVASPLHVGRLRRGATPILEIAEICSGEQGRGGIDGEDSFTRDEGVKAA